MHCILDARHNVGYQVCMHADGEAAGRTQFADGGTELDFEANPSAVRSGDRIPLDEIFGEVPVAFENNECDVDALFLR